MQNTDYFTLLSEQLPLAKNLSEQKNAMGFLGQEILRFNSIAGTLINSFKLDVHASIDERYITHPLIRSLLENYFKIIYIFDDSELEGERFEKAVNGFKIDYLKLINDLKQVAWDVFMREYEASLQSPNDDWNNLPKLNNINDILTALKNEAGDKLQYLYSIYRITSFDVHGNSLKIFFDKAFGTQCDFLILDIRYVINLIASSYIELLNKHKS